MRRLPKVTTRRPRADEVAAERLIARRASAMNRLPDGRARRQWAYALLARNGFDPDVAARVAGRAGSPEQPTDLD